MNARKLLHGCQLTNILQRSFRRVASIEFSPAFQSREERKLGFTSRSDVWTIHSNVATRRGTMGVQDPALKRRPKFNRRYATRPEPSVSRI